MSKILPLLAGLLMAAPSLNADEALPDCKIYR
jgi:hypothetical protein